MPKIKSSNKTPYLLALTIAVLAVLIYVITGQAKLDQNKQRLQHSDNVAEIDIQRTAGSSLITVTCEDGSQYELYYPPGSDDFETLKQSKCGT